MKEILAVFIGGGLGSLARYGIIRSLSPLHGAFPVATFTANLFSCLIVGVLIAFIERKISLNSMLIHLLVIGFCGGFSTFSTFIRENYLLIEAGKVWLFIIYSVTSFGLGLLLLLSGIWVGKLIVH